MQYILRTISLSMAVFILIPLVLLMHIVFGVFELFNNFTYYNFKESKVSADKLEVIAFVTSTRLFYIERFEIFFRIIILFFTPIFTIFANVVNSVKTIRF